MIFPFQILRRLPIQIFLVVACMACSTSFAVSETQRPVRIVVPSAAGGTPDTLLRAITAEITKMTGQAFVIDNKPGASGLIGMSEIARAPADGSTLGYANNVTLSINNSTFKKLPYDPSRLVPVTLLFKVPNVIAINPALPIRTYAELVAYAKAHPDKLSYASPGQGTSGHLTGELLAQNASITLKHVPYRGSPQAVTDVLGGQVDIMIDNMPTMMPYLQQGKLRALAVTSLSRLPQVPEVPTVSESGLTGFEGAAWGGNRAAARRDCRADEVVQCIVSQDPRCPSGPGKISRLGRRDHRWNARGTYGLRQQGDAQVVGCCKARWHRASVSQARP